MKWTEARLPKTRRKPNSEEKRNKLETLTDSIAVVLGLQFYRGHVDRQGGVGVEKAIPLTQGIPIPTAPRIAKFNAPQINGPPRQLSILRLAMMACNVACPRSKPDNPNQSRNSARHSIGWDVPRTLPTTIYNSPTSVIPNPFTVEKKRLKTSEEIYQFYVKHRTKRHVAQLESILSNSVRPDPILINTLKPGARQEDCDSRYSLCFWIRPTSYVLPFFLKIQSLLCTLDEPNLWLQPSETLHMTLLEIISGGTSRQLSSLIAKTKPHLRQLLETRGCRLAQPMLTCDRAAFAITFVSPVTDNWGHLHLREQLWDNCVKDAQVVPQMRYCLPSAHVTIARWIGPAKGNGARIQDTVDKINKMIDDIWEDIVNGVWTVADNGGIEGVRCLSGLIWYGAGQEHLP